MAHGREKKCHARFGGKNVSGFLPYFGHPEQVFFWIDLLEDRMGRGKLIPQKDDQALDGRRFAHAFNRL